MRPRAPLALGLVLAAAVAGADQASKLWVVGLMRPEGVGAVPVATPHAVELTSFFNLVLTWNRGVSFGTFNDPTSPIGAWLLAGFSLAVAVGLVAWMAQAEKPWLGAALGLVAGGAVGNAVDRLHWGAVADFLDFHLAGHHWWAFNLADSAITVGAAMLVVDSLFAKRDSHTNTL